MQVGVFVPINNNGWLISENAPQYKPSFDLNKAIAQSACIQAQKHGCESQQPNQDKGPALERHARARFCYR